MENNRIVIDLGFAKLVAEKGIDDKYNEIYVGIEKNGVIGFGLGQCHKSVFFKQKTENIEKTIIEKGKEIKPI